MTSPLVSIIVPCFNQSEFLSEALNSVKSQTYTNWECIIVNDGSFDNTEQIALDYCNDDIRFKYFKQHNQGLAQTRNNGIRNSNGTFILPLDADDRIGETYLELAVNKFLEHPETTLVYCKAELFGKKNQPWVLPKYNYNDILWENSIFCTAMYKRSDFDKTIGYNPNMKYGFEDWDFWLSLLTKSSIVYQIDNTLFFYRQRNISMTTTTTIKKNELYKTLINNHKDLYLPYITNLIELKKEHEELKNAYQLLSNIMSSDEYRIGTMITKRFPFLGKLIIRLGNRRKDAQQS